MPVIRIREIDDLDQRLVVEYKSIPYCAVHQLAQASSLFLGYVWAVSPQGPAHLIEDLVSPLGLYPMRLLCDAY